MVPAPRQMITNENTDAFTLPGLTCLATMRTGDDTNVPTRPSGDFGVLGADTVEDRLPSDCCRLVFAASNLGYSVISSVSLFLMFEDALEEVVYFFESWGDV